DLVLHVPEADGSAMAAYEDGGDLVAALESGATAVEVVGDVDLTTAAGNAAVVQRALERFGRLDAACFVTGSILVGRFLQATDEQWELRKGVTLDWVSHAGGRARPRRAAAGRGQVVVFPSAPGARPEPKVALYSSTRAGANALVRAVGLEYAATGVTVNAI